MKRILTNTNDRNRKEQKKRWIPLGYSLGAIALYCISASWAKGHYPIQNPVMTAVLLADAVIITAVLFFKRWISEAGLDTGKQTKPGFFSLSILTLLLMALPNLVFIFIAPASIAAEYGSALIFAIISMSLVGYLEEVIFRGMLFDSIEKDSLKQAVIITSLTFGIGHLSNLFTGQNLSDTLLQIAYAVCVGYAFVVARIASGNIWMCVIVHALIDVLSLFISPEIGSIGSIAGSVFIMAAALFSAWLIRKANPDHCYF